MAFLSSADPETVFLSFENDMVEFLRSRLQRYATTEEMAAASDIFSLFTVLSGKGLTLTMVPLPFNFFNVIIHKEMAPVENFLVCFAFPQGFVQQQITFANMHPVAEVVMLVPHEVLAKGVSLDDISNLFGPVQEG